MTRRLPAPLWRRAAVLAGALSVAAVAGCSSGPASGPTSQDIAITFSRGNCGAAWSAPAGGTRTFQLHNTSGVTAEVDLVDPTTGGVYAEVEALATGTTRPMRVSLGKGAYALRCLAEETQAATGPVTRISTGPAGSPAVLPVTVQDLTGPIAAYKAYVTAGLGTLATDTTALDQAMHGGDLATARSRWLKAHLQYERLGAAYDAFGDVGDAIDGLPQGLPGGVRDADFTGFHRIEYGLWHGESPAALTGLADRLSKDVADLREQFGADRIDPLDLPLRSHEIMEDALQFQLTGEADQGSGSSLGTVEANLDGTRAALDALRPLLSSRYPGLVEVTSALARTRQLVDAHRQPAGGWTPVGALSQLDRERLNGTVGQLLELLAPVAAIGDIRRTS